MFDGNKFERLSRIGAVAATAMGLYLSSLYSYLLFHSLIEIVTIAVAFTLFILTWNTRAYLANNYLKLLGIGYAFIALIDLTHTLAYKGLEIFPGYGANLPTQLWIAARYLQAVTLLAAPFFLERRLNDHAVFAAYIAAVAALLAMTFSGNFPDCYVEGQGLTAFKIGSEYLITAVLVAALYFLYRQRKYFNDRVFVLAGSAIACTALSEICFTAYVSVYGFANLLGHFSKLAAFYLIYRAILVTGLQEPFALVFRNLKRAEDELLESRDTLEEKVRERTAELRASDEQYRRIVNTASEGIWMLGPDTLTTFVNAKMADMLGYSVADMIGRPVTDFMFAEDVSDHLRKMEERRHGRSESYERRLRRKDGQAVWAFASATPIFDDERRFAGTFAMFVDITERKQAESLLYTSEQAFRAVVENSPDVIVRYDREGRRIYVNPEFERVNRLSAQEVYGKKPLELSTELKPMAGIFTEKLMAAMASGTIAKIDLSWTKDGKPKCWFVRVVPEFDAHGEVVSALTLWSDIFERKAAEEEIRKLNQELEAFAYSVSHDLRAPLRHIDGFLALLEERNATTLDEESRHYMATISKAARRMAALIDDLLSFSRMGRFEMAKTQVDLGTLVQDVIRELEPEAHGRAIEWRIGDLPVATGDRAMLRVVLVNLISNALKFTQKRPSAEIEIGALAGHEPETVVFVRDNGAGFDMKFADRLFGVFQRLHGTDEFEGTGIGLANVRQVITRHHGRTWAEGTVDGGATFYFSLPQTAAADSLQ